MVRDWSGRTASRRAGAASLATHQAGGQPAVRWWQGLGSSGSREETFRSGLEWALPGQVGEAMFEDLGNI